MTVIDFIGNTTNFYNYLLFYFDGKTKEYYELNQANWWEILRQIGTGVKLNPVFENENFQTEGMTCYTYYCHKWEHLAKLFLLNYNPIENYNMRENMLDYEETAGEKEDFTNYSEKQTGNSASGTTSRAGKVISGITVEEGNVNVSVTDGVNVETEHYTTTMDDIQTDRKQYKDKNTGTSTNDTLNGFYNETTKDGDINRTPNKLEKKITDEITETEVDTTRINGHKGNRTGNIGVTTTQQMAMSELDYAKYINLAKIICSDVIDFLGAGVYEYDD